MQDERKERRRTVIRDECAARGIAIEEREHGYLLRGPGVDLRVADLASIDGKDLQPYYPRARLRP